MKVKFDKQGNRIEVNKKTVENKVICDFCKEEITEGQHVIGKWHGLCYTALLRKDKGRYV